MSEEAVIYECKNIGVSGTTPIFIKKLDSEMFECRVGVAIMGSTNMPIEELALANPFDDSFHDNFASGIGQTELDAIDACKKDMKLIADSLWAF